MRYFSHKSDTHHPVLTFVEPLLGLGHYQSDIIGSILKDVNGGGMREPFHIHIVNRYQPVTCVNITAGHSEAAAASLHVGEIGRKKKTNTSLPGFKQPLTSAGPPGVTELTMVPSPVRPEFSPPTTWKPRRRSQRSTKT